MKLRLMLLGPAAMLSTATFGENFSTTCQDLIDKLQEEQSGFAGAKDVYECGPDFTHISGEKPVPVNGCLVYFEYQHNPYPPSTIGAFQDAANNHLVSWIPQNSGWDYSGKYVCADIKTYVRVTNSGDSATVEIRRQTASDGLFCPFSKIFTAYSTTCHKVN